MLEAELEGRPAEEAGKRGLAPVADLKAAPRAPSRVLPWE